MLSTGQNGKKTEQKSVIYPFLCVSFLKLPF